MNVEDEYFLALENRDTQLMIANKKLEEKEEQLSQQQERLSQQHEQLSQQQEQLSQQKEMIAKLIRSLHASGNTIEQIAVLVQMEAEEVRTILAQEQNNRLNI